MTRIHERTPYNQLTVRIFEPLSLTERVDITGALDKAVIISYGTFYPGGLYSAFSMLVPMNVTTPIPWKGADRVEIRNGLDVVWEGEITFIGFAIQGKADQGLIIESVGFWGRLLGRKLLDKRWADTRFTADVWKPNKNASGYELAQTDREDRLRIIPDNVLWRDEEVYALVYTMPTGQFIKRVKITEYMRELATPSPVMVKHFSGTYFDMESAIDGDPSTGNARTLGSSDYLYIMCPYPTVTGIDFDLGTSVNNNTASMVVQFWDGDKWTTVTGLSDGTRPGSATLAQDGTMTWTAPETIARTTIDGVSGYGIRMSPSAGLDSVGFREIVAQGQEQWELRLFDYAGATTIWSRTSTGGSARDDILGTPRPELEFELRAKAQQMPSGDGSDVGYYGEGTKITVYSETGAINLTEIAKDIVDKFTDINSDKTKILSNPLSLEPFYTDGPEYATDILLRAAGFGDASKNSWAVYLLASDVAKAPDGNPVLGVSVYPPLTDYDYGIRIDEKNLLQPFQISQDFDHIANWIVVKHVDAEGNTIYWTPDTISGLRDDTSMNAYNLRALLVNAGKTDVDAALEYGYRILKARKDPRFIVTGPIRVVGYIRDKDGLRVPSSAIRAGMRIRVEDFLDDMIGESGTGLTFLITKTNYSHKDEVCSISAGLPDDLAVYMAQREMRENAVIGK